VEKKGGGLWEGRGGGRKKVKEGERGVGRRQKRGRGGGGEKDERREEMKKKK